MLLSCAALALLMYYRSRPAPSGGEGKNVGAGGSAVSGAGGGVYGGETDPWIGVDGLLGGNGTAVEGIGRERWKELAGWGDVPLSDLEDWAPLGPDPQGCLPRTSAKPEAHPHVLVGWGFGSPKLTLYTYRALESILHVYPGAHVKIITVGPRYAYFYKWANIIALTQFQKYSKRGYDVKVDIYFGKMPGKTMVKGRAIPGHRWWKRNEDSLLYGEGMKISKFQAIQEAVPDAYVTIFLALVEMYTQGGMYVDLTTFFVRPLPADLDGFVAGGQGQGADGAAGDCSTPTSAGRRQRPFVMQYRAPQHPVVACALREYDQEVSALNECIVLSKGNGQGGMDCVLEALEACTEKEGLTNDLRLSGVVEWHGCGGITERRGTTAAAEGSGSGAGAGAGAAPPSRALVAARGTAFGPATPDRVSLMWMGPQATDGSWWSPEEGSLWAEAFARLRLTRWKPQQVSASCRIPCGHWDTLSPEGSRASEAAKAQASFQCAPRVFVPGTQKGASTFLFHAISWHPQMVQPLRGAHGFKETGRYSPGVATGPDKLGLRLAAFPFVEEHENFATGDGSVIYMLHNMKTPEAILADNPHAKIVFALRDPVARAWSDFRFLWGVYQKQVGFPSIIEMSLDKTRECFEGHMGENPQPFDFGDGGPGQLILPDEEEEAIQHFFSRCSTVKDPGQIVRKGIYYYQVLHWMRVFGRDNVMIVDSADLKSRQKETIEEVYRFLGLCPVDISKLEPENVTNSPNIPEHMKITAESYKALQEFYEPFNKKLYKLLGRDLGWEKNSFKARRR
eukprot:g15963.t1